MVLVSDIAYLFIPNCKLALSLLVVLGESLQLLHRLCLQNRCKEFDVLFCVFMTRLGSSVFQSTLGTGRYKRILT